MEDWLAQEIVRSSPDAIVFADREGIIREWNAAAERMFGYAASEAIGRSLDIIIPENLRARHWTGYHQVMHTGITRYGTEVLSVPALRNDGTRLSLEFGVALVRSPGGELAGIVATLRDVTERWRRDKEIRERLARLEKRTAS
ncbi:MAG: PAS domain S-box protein [Candidatus Binatia bacterium]